MYAPNYTISDALLGTIAEIESYRSCIATSYILPVREVGLRYRATVEATHSSTSIEGNPLTIKQVELALSNQSSKPVTRHQYAEREVRNYKKALDFVDKRKNRTEPITTTDILQIHAYVMDGLLPAEKTGAFRKNDIYITGEEDSVAYVGPSAKRLQKEVSSLLAWLESAGNIHPVIASAIFHFHFVSIHPFADGNGRVTRILTALYLGLRDYDFRGALVLDSYYAVERLDYYRALSIANNYEGRKTAQLDSWLDYFAGGFLTSAKTLSLEIELLSNVVQPQKATRLNQDEADLLSYAKQFKVITLLEAEGILPHLSRRTIQRKLKKLADEGFLLTKEKGRATRYEWAE